MKRIKYRVNFKSWIKMTQCPLKFYRPCASHQRSRTFPYCFPLLSVQTGLSGARGPVSPPQDFGSSYIEINGGEYTHHINTCPPGFLNLPTPLFFQLRRGFGHSREVDERSGRRFRKLWENPRQSYIF